MYITLCCFRRNGSYFGCSNSSFVTKRGTYFIANTLCTVNKVAKQIPKVISKFNTDRSFHRILFPKNSILIT